MGLRVPILEDIFQKKKKKKEKKISLCTFPCAYNQQCSFEKKGKMVCIKKESKSLKFSSVLM